MSILATIRSKIRDLNALEAALREFGGTLHMDQKQYMQYNSNNKCDHAIRFEGKNMEMGLIKQPDGSYNLEYDHMLDDLVGENASKLIDAYNVHKTILDSIALGYSASELAMEKDGTRVVEVQVMEY